MRQRKKFDGGVASVRVMPIPMQDGGDPSTKLLAEGPPPTQFKLPDERMYLNRKQMDTFPMPKVEGPISSEPNVGNIPGADQMMEGTQLQEKLFTTPVINPNEVYRNDPDPFIEGFFDPMPQSTGGIPNLLQANMLKPLGILSINKTYKL